jgi:COP9 signalosome complex subunit 1
LGLNRTLARPKIREGAMVLGELCVKRGDFNSALLRYLNAKENSTRPEEIEVSWLIVLASVYMETMTHVSSAASRALAMKEISEKPEYAARFNVALGMLQLKASNYHKAVEYFFAAAIQGPANIENVDFDFVTWKDIATYTGIAALGSFGRHELKVRILDDPIARKTLETVPWLKSCINKFYQTKYSVALQALEAYNPTALQDRYLGPHWKRLLRRVRSRAIAQYTAPFSSVDLRAMAGAFQMDLVEFEKELAELIQDGEINFRIDSGSKVLWENSINPRIRAFNHAVKVGDDFNFHARLSLLKVHLQKNGIQVGKEEGFQLRSRQSGGERKDFE